MTTRVRELREEDFEGFQSFMLEHFYAHEPLLQTPGDHNKYPVTPERWAERLEIIRQGLSLVAVDENDRIVGMVLANRMLPEELEKNWLKTKETKPSDLLSHVWYFLSKIEWDSQIFQRYDVPQALYLNILCVNATIRRQGLGGRLVRALMDVGRTKGFHLLFSTCTSHYSARVMAAQGLELVLAVKYADYRDEDGNPPIRPPAPHTETAVMAIRL